MESEEEYDFEYSENEEEEGNVDLENTYYNAKALRNDQPEEAIKEFSSVVEIEEQLGCKGEWGFKAMKQKVKLFYRLGRTHYEPMMMTYQGLLSYSKEHISQNMSEKGINSILDLLSSSLDWDLLSFIYETTLTSLQESKNDRLWFKTNLKLGYLLFQTGDYGRLQKVIKELLRCCGGINGTDESDDMNIDTATFQQRGTQLQEVYALQIQLYSIQQDNKKLRELYHKALRVKSGLPHPRTLGIILECGGKMHMQEKEWGVACTSFFQAFKNYDEAGESRRLQCLQYLVLASMLEENAVDPFASQEARPYKSHPEIIAMTSLVSAFRNDNIKEFEQIMKEHRERLMADAFVRNYIDNLLRTIRTQVLTKVIKPYTKITLSYLAKELNGIAVKEVEDLLVGLILDHKIQGKIDQVQGIFVRTASGSPSSFADKTITHKSQSLRKWAECLGSLPLQISVKVSK